MPERQKLSAEQAEVAGILARELPVLRTALRMSQAELGAVIGISRQGYNFFETLSRPLPWSTFVPLFLYFEARAETRRIIQTLGDFEQRTLALMDVATPLAGDAEERSGTERDEPAALCLYCGSRNPEGVKFCGECGTRIGESARLCNSCGEQSQGGAKFCGMCGARII